MIKLNVAQFTVTRQCRWQDGKSIVEVSQGGLDFTNPDALCKKYPGEFDTFSGKVAAVEAAIAIAKRWKADQPNEEICIATGCTHGMTMAFDEQPISDEVFAALLEDAKQFDEELPKCERCGEILSGQTYGNEFTIMMDNEYPFCSENCANVAWEDEMKLMAEEDEAEEDEEEDE